MYLCFKSRVLISRWQLRVISVFVIIQTLSEKILIALKHCLSLVFYFSSSNKWILCLVSLRHFLKHWNRHPVTVESQENILKNTWPGSVASMCDPNVPTKQSPSSLRSYRPVGACSLGRECLWVAGSLWACRWDVMGLTYVKFFFHFYCKLLGEQERTGYRLLGETE